MVEIFQNFEQMMGRFTPSIIIISGVVFLLLGLCMWLGGLALRKILILITGLVSGFAAGLFVVGRNLFSASLLAGFSALIALIFEKVLVVLLAALLASTITFTITAEPYFEQEQATEIQNDTTEQTTIAKIDDIIYEMKTFGHDAGIRIKQAGIKIPLHIWAIIAAPAVILLICGVVLWRFTSALFFSVTGTITASFGIILMLIYKGTEPAGFVRKKLLTIAAAFLVIAAFGTAIQLLLFKKTKKEKITKIKPNRKNARNNNEPETIVEHDWRSA